MGLTARVVAHGDDRPARRAGPRSGPDRSACRRSTGCRRSRRPGSTDDAARHGGERRSSGVSVNNATRVVRSARARRAARRRARRRGRRACRWARAPPTAAAPRRDRWSAERSPPAAGAAAISITSSSAASRPICSRTARRARSKRVVRDPREPACWPSSRGRAPRGSLARPRGRVRQVRPARPAMSSSSSSACSTNSQSGRKRVARAVDGRDHLPEQERRHRRPCAALRSHR